MANLGCKTQERPTLHHHSDVSKGPPDPGADKVWIFFIPNLHLHIYIKVAVFIIEV
jgi:hypothetical protein